MANTSVKTLSFKDAAGTTVTNNTAYDSVTINTTDGKATISAETVGTYVLKFNANGLSRTLNVSVVAADTSATTSYAFEMSDNKADAVITAEAKDEAKITAQVFQLNGGVKSGQIKDIKATLTKADGTTVTSGASVTSGVVTVAVNNFKTGEKLAAGTYTLTVAPTDPTSKVPTFTRNIVISDSQTLVTVKRTAESGASVSSCFEFYLNGEKLTTTEAKFYYGDKDVTDTKAGNTTPVTTAKIKYQVGNHTVQQTVNIGLSVTVK